MPSGVTRILYFVHLGIILILVLEFYSGLSGRVKTVYLFSLCVVSLLSSRFTATALVWFSNFHKYLIRSRSSWILWLFIHQGAFSMDRRVLEQ
jgi:general stress protein CsbA